ncbi:hypothetical protein PR202_ga31421 [Eleusine coracana subsp. coracana]|uniref:Uncharacterized protein n=1 Tax=Eleusine coracana subsp. coracana TaxID=191504 RepID=A0AAV5DRW0_ELECO|nr:hypothetical protein PR202_ga31421 [Eleusine coracana subsp. coracana]
MPSLTPSCTQPSLLAIKLRRALLRASNRAPTCYPQSSSAALPPAELPDGGAPPRSAPSLQPSSTMLPQAELLGDGAPLAALKLVALRVILALEKTRCGTAGGAGLRTTADAILGGSQTLASLHRDPLRSRFSRNLVFQGIDLGRSCPKRGHRLLAKHHVYIKWIQQHGINT